MAKTLYVHAKEQFGLLFHGAEKDDVYGVGFFCDISVGDALCVANTEQYYQSSLRAFEAQFGAANADQFRWDIGNWKYPAGLPSVSSEDFHADWRPYQESLRELADDQAQQKLEQMCGSVLERLCDEGIFSGARGLEGFNILGPDDPANVVLAKRQRLQSLLRHKDR